MTLLVCGHTATQPASLPSDLDGQRVCVDCHTDAARTVLARLRPGQRVALYLDGRSLVTWYGAPMMRVAAASKTTLWAVDRDGRGWHGRAAGGQWLLTLSNIEGVEL